MAIDLHGTGAVGVPGVWAPKNLTIATIAGEIPVSGLVVFWTIGQGQKTDANWQTPEIKWNGQLLTRIGASYSTTSNGGSQRAYYIPTTVNAGSLQIHTPTDFYVDAGTVSYAFLDGHDGLGAVVPGYAGHSALLTTGIPEAAAGSLILSHAVGVYTPQLNLIGGTPTPALELSNNTASNDLSLRMSSQVMIANGPSVVNWQPPYNETNSITIEFTGSSAPGAQKLTVPSIVNTATALGVHLAKDPNLSVAAPLSIVNDETALGSHEVIKQNVVYYELNGPGNVASGSPATIVERVTEASNYRISRGSTPVIYGEKKYWEIKVDAIAPTSKPAVGVSTDSVQLHLQLGGWQSDAIGWDNGGNALDNNTGMNGRPLYEAGDVLMIAVDMAQDRGWVFMGKNGVWYNGTAPGVNFASGDGRVNTSARSTSVGLYPALQTQMIGDKFTTNFGREEFIYTPPAGFTGLDNPSGPVKKTLSVPSLVNQEAFGSAEIMLLSTVLLPAGLLNTSALGAHGIIQLAKSSALVNVSVLGNHYVRPRLNPAGIANLSSLGSHIVGHRVKAPAILNTSVLGSHKLSVRLDVPGIENAAVVGAHSVQTTYQIEVSGILNVEAFGTHNLNQRIGSQGFENVSELGFHSLLAGPVSLAPESLVNVSVTGSHTAKYIIKVSGINNQNSFGNTFVTHIYEDAGVYVPSITNISEMGDHALRVSIQMDGIGPVEAFLGSHKVVEVPKLLVPGIANVTEYGEHLFVLSVKPNGITNNNQVGTHNIRLLPKGLLPESIVNLSEIAAPRLAYGIRVSGLLNVSEIGAPSIGATLSVAAIVNNSYLGNHQVNELFAETDKFIRDGDHWAPVAAMLVKYDGQWRELEAVLEKKDGVWEQIM